MQPEPNTRGRSRGFTGRHFMHFKWFFIGLGSVIVAMFVIQFLRDRARANSEVAVASGSPLEIVRGLVKAHNAHDVEAMLNYVHDDVEWLSIAADSAVIEARGSDALKQAMEDYFDSVPSARSEIEESMVSGSYVAVRERAYWQEKTGESSQFSLSVYETRDEKIVRVWYFPSQE